MSLSILTEPFTWYRYSRKLCKKIENPRSVGFFTKEAAANRSMHLAEGIEGSIENGNLLALYWLVDPDDGIIVDAKFQIFGQSALIGAAEAACELVIGKNYDQARRITADLIDKQLRDNQDKPAFPKETYPLLNLVLEAISKASELCKDIPLTAGYIAPPVHIDQGEEFEKGHPDWETFSIEQRLQLVEEILNQEIRPYIALDAGGVDIKELNAQNQLSIIYKGSCTSCISSIGATLSFIQQVLRRKAHPSIVVIPDVSPE